MGAVVLYLLLEIVQKTPISPEEGTLLAWLVELLHIMNDIVFVLFFAFEQLVRLYADGLEYLSDTLNFVDFGIVCFSVSISLDEMLTPAPIVEVSVVDKVLGREDDMVREAEEEAARLKAESAGDAAFLRAIRLIRLFRLAVLIGRMLYNRRVAKQVEANAEALKNTAKKPHLAYDTHTHNYLAPTRLMPSLTHPSLCVLLNCVYTGTILSSR